jgi:hypothetical protein
MTSESAAFADESCIDVDRINVDIIITLLAVLPLALQPAGQ